MVGVFFPPARSEPVPFFESVRPHLSLLKGAAQGPPRGIAERSGRLQGPRGGRVCVGKFCAPSLGCLAWPVEWYTLFISVCLRPKAARALPRAPPNGLPVPLSSNEEPPPTSRPIPSLSYPVSYGRGRSQHPRLLLTTEGEQGPHPVEAIPVLILMCGLCFPRSPTPS